MAEIKGVQVDNKLQNAIKIDGRTNRLEQPATKLADTVAENISKGTKESWDKATSILMDLWLEDKNDKRFNEVLKLASEQIYAKSQFGQFKMERLDPSIEVMSQIKRGSLVAEKFDYNVAVKSPENLKNIGLEFSTDMSTGKNRGNIIVVFAPDTTVSLNGKPIDFNKEILRLDNLTKGVTLIETQNGFEMQITNIDGSVDRISITPAKPGTSLPHPSSDWRDREKPYTPGTRYATACKDEINYKLPR